MVAWGSVGRALKLERSSSGWSPSAVRDNKPTPEGVGVNGGGFKGDPEIEAALRFFGGGVTCGAKFESGSRAPLMVSLVASGDVVVALLCFFDATGLTFSYFATALFAFPSVIAGALLLATLAERLRDMVCGLRARLVRVIV